MAGEQTTATYDVPLKYTDGTDIKPGDILAYEIGYGVKPRAQTGDTYPNVITDALFEAGRQTTVLDALDPGDYYAAARAKVKGAVSTWGAEQLFTVKPKIPEPPRNFSIA